MKLRPITPEEFKAIQSAAWLHGRNFKTAIRRAWYSGNYSRESLGDYSGTLQRMRNSADGQDVLESLRTKDFVATPAAAFILGGMAARNEAPRTNPFGVDSLAKEWRKGFQDAASKMDYLSRPILL